MKWLGIAFLAFFLTSCTPQMQVQNPETVGHIWSVLHPESHDTAITAQFSLQMETREKTGRLLGQAWGYSSSLVRLDLTSGAGNSVAMIRDTPALWTAYLPAENKAYHHTDARIGLDMFDIPVPFNARQVCSLLVGDFNSIIPTEYSKVRTTQEGKIRFSFAKGDVEYLETTESMDEIFVKGYHGWTLFCEKPSERALFPEHRMFEKFTFTAAEDKAVMRIKSLENGGKWQQVDLDLRLPDTVQWMRLDPDAQHNIN